MRPLKIALATPVLVKTGDGQGRVNYEIARAAAERGHNVTLLATKVDDELASDERFRWIRLRAYGIPSDAIRTQIAGFYGSRWLAAHRQDFDIIQGSGSFTISDTHVNTAHFVHGTWLHSPFHTSRARPGLFGTYHGALTRLYAYQEAIAYRRARSVIAPSSLVRRELETTGVDPEKIRVIANGVDCVAFHPGSADRAELGLPTDRFLALFAGELATPRKNIESILRALRSAEAVHLVAVGSVKGSPYPAMARELGVADRVTFLGFRTDLARIMRAVDAFVFPSRYDTFALVVLEAMASGLPVVTASTVGAADIVAEGGCTVLADPDDVPALAAELRSLVADPGRTKTLAAASREVALRYSWRRMTDEYLDVYEQLSDAQQAEVVQHGFRRPLQLTAAGELEVENGA